MSANFDTVRDITNFYEPGHGYEEIPAPYDSNYTSNSQDDEMTGVDFGVVLSPNETIGYSENYTEERNWVVVGVLIALIVVLWVILGLMLCVPLVRCIKRRMPVSKKRINRRYDTIEGWLITKTVKPHDNGCDKLQNKFSEKAGDIESQEQTRMKHTESYDTADTTMIAEDTFFMDQDERECPICMEHFVVGDVVSWSSYETCTHTYHHQCIKEWLLRHNNCPFCREIFLPVDKVHTKITMKMFKELSDLRAQRAEKTFYCIQDGLVTLEEKSSLHNTSSTTVGPSLLRKCGHIRSSEYLQLKEKLKAGVTKADLRKLRGNRCEKVCYEGAPIPDIIEDQEVPSAEASTTESPSNPLAVSLRGAEHVTSNIPQQIEDEPFASGDSSTVSSNDQNLSIYEESSSVSSTEEAAELDVRAQEPGTITPTKDSATENFHGSNDNELGLEPTDRTLGEMNEPCNAPINVDTQLKTPDDLLMSCDEFCNVPKATPNTEEASTILSDQTVVDISAQEPKPIEELSFDSAEDQQAIEEVTSVSASCQSSDCGEPEQSCVETKSISDRHVGTEKSEESCHDREGSGNVSEAGDEDQLPLALSSLSARSEMDVESGVGVDYNDGTERRMPGGSTSTEGNNHSSYDHCDVNNSAARSQQIPQRMASF